MSADAYVLDMGRAVEAQIRCYFCAHVVYHPKDHQQCLDLHPEYDRLPVLIEMVNVEDY